MTTATKTDSRERIDNRFVLSTEAGAVRRVERVIKAWELVGLRWVIATQDGGFYPLAYGEVALRNAHGLAQSSIRVVG